MTTRLSRQALYELVWAEPMRTLSTKFGTTEAALKKICSRAQIPVPHQARWVNSRSGELTMRVALKARPPGMDDEVVVGRAGELEKDDLLVTLPPPPQFPESIDSVRGRIATALGKVTFAKHVRAWHPAVNRLIKDEEKRSERVHTETFVSSWQRPRFDIYTQFGHRRLLIINALLAATTKFNGKISISTAGYESRQDKSEMNISVIFHQINVWFSLNPIRPASRQSSTTTRSSELDEPKLALHICSTVETTGRQAFWQDTSGARLETHLTQIATELILMAEILYRTYAVQRHEARVNNKARLAEKVRERIAAGELIEQERLERNRQLRIEGLLRDAAAYRQAADIRLYVAAVRSSASSSLDVDHWCQWALEQADRIDPINSGNFFKAFKVQ